MSEQSATIHVNDVALNIVDVGEGAPALVFLHYWGGSSRTWAPVIERLAPGNRCVAIDFRGWGASSKEGDDFRLETLAGDVIGVAEALDLKSYIVVGHSMGGKVAQLVAARHPAGLEGLILIAPAPPTPLDVPEEVRRSYVELYQTRAGAETVIGNLTPHLLPEAHREQIIADTLRGAPAAKRAWPEDGMVQDISDRVATIRVPLHVVAGGDDQVETAASLRAAFDKLPTCAGFTVIPGSGHMIPLEAPAALAEAIRAAPIAWKRRDPSA
jgi:pimeloyl-ACP methyl ester carboxylesterase